MGAAVVLGGVRMKGRERAFAAVVTGVRNADKAAVPLFWWCQLHQRVLAIRHGQTKLS
jgi:hypothetical protein